MKNLVETLNEAIAIKNVSFDLKNDIYNEFIIALNHRRVKWRRDITSARASD